MTYSVEISKQADIDLRNIYEYIAFELQASQNASSQLERIERRIYSLAQMPNRHRRYEKEPWHSQGLRIMPVDNYCIFYIPDLNKKTVHILRVLYGGRNMDVALVQDDKSLK